MGQRDRIRAFLKLAEEELDEKQITELIGPAARRDSASAGKRAR